MVWFIYKDYLIKIEKADLKKQLKNKKKAAKKKEEDLGFDSNDENLMGFSKREGDGTIS